MSVLLRSPRRAPFFIIEERPLVLRVIGAAFGVKHLNDALLTP